MTSLAPLGVFMIAECRNFRANFEPAYFLARLSVGNRYVHIMAATAAMTKQ
jgi:hypothetical protein